MATQYSIRILVGIALLAGSVPGTAAAGQPPATQSSTAGVSPDAMAQIAAILAEKRARTPDEQKIDSQLLYGARLTSGGSLASSLSALEVALPMTRDDRVVLDVRATVSAGLIDRIRALGAQVTDSSAQYDHIGVSAPLNLVRAIAAIPEVRFISPDYGYITAGSSIPRSLRMVSSSASAALAPARSDSSAQFASALRVAVEQRSAALGSLTNSGSVSTQGDVTHEARDARVAFNVSGFGVRIGVLSDGVDGLAQSQASGNIGGVVVLAGQAGSGTDGTAMLEVITDLAPGAELYFATASGGPARFAQNIRALRAAGCDIIVDELSYLAESPFQDGQTVASPTNGGIITQAVKDVAASGALYLTAAFNLGNLDSAASGTWEGDFVDGGPVTGVIADAGETGRVHSFGAATFNSVIAGVTIGTLTWSDPLGASDNDYDVFVLDSAGTTIISASTNRQQGTQDPIEAIVSFPGARIVVVKFAGADRYLRLATNGGQLSIATAGAIFGHAAATGPNIFAVGATPACGPCSAPFTAASRVEPYSSDGPRRIFFTESGAAFTPGNLTSTGGIVVNKPDFIGADAVATSVLPNYVGTSAAAAHVAGIAALVKSANRAQTAAQVASTLIASAIDIHAPGFDRDSGYGIVMAYDALALILPRPPTPAAPVLNITRAFTDVTHATVAWQPVPFATFYTLKYSTAPGAPKTFIYYSGPAKTLLAAGLARGVHYYFALTASNRAGTSPDSNEVQFYVPPGPKALDFNGDNHQDLVLYRPSTGTWSWSVDTVSSATKQFGNQALGDVPFTADIDGDGRTDLIVWRASTGTWYWATSSTNFTDGGSKQWGNQGLGDIPLVGDVDGDGKVELIVWRASTGTWYWATSTSNYTNGFFLTWGNQSLGDRPFVADMDGDMKADFAVWRASSGTWYWITAGTNFAGGGIRQFGNLAFGDIPMLGDIDGDGRSDLVIWRASNSTFFWVTSTTGFASGGFLQHGDSTQGDVPLLRDFSGFGFMDLVVWRPTTNTFLWIDHLTGLPFSRVFGDAAAGDVPIR